MIKFELTNRQKLYLLHFKDSKEDQTISVVANHFNCTKVNSKYILDKMVKIGILYKVKNSFKLTQIGENVARGLQEKRDKIQRVLEVGLEFTREKAVNFSNYLITLEAEEISEEIIERWKYFNTSIESSPSIDYRQLEKILGHGEYNIMFCIYKNSGDCNESHIPKSMAMMGFNKTAKIYIGNNSKIVLKSNPVSKEHKGYAKRGILSGLSYFENNEEKVIESKDRDFEIPLELFKQWHYLGSGLFQSGGKMNSKVRVSLNMHKECANFLFTLNLLTI